MPIKKDILKQIEELRKEINKHNKYYYIDNNPQISDFEYDVLMKQLIELEKQYPEYITPDSPTQKVGGEPIKEFKTVTHKTPMKSLGNTYNEDDLREFDKKVRKDVGNSVEYCVEPKIDGVSISIIYENGTLLRAVTRGDGVKGDDVTTNIKTIRSLPMQLPKPLNIELRGEVYIKVSDFDRLNKEREEKGEKTFANPRNFTSGTLKTLDPKEVAKRPLRVFFYYIVDIENNNDIISLETHFKRLEYIKSLDLPVVEYYKLCKNLDEVIGYIDYFDKVKEELDYETDGMVLKVNSIAMQNELGYTSKEPKWAIAYKYPPKQVTTTIKDIIYQVGRLGSITPVAKVEPVSVSGSTVSSASLHNFDEIERKDVRIGDVVFIEKAGEIIPQVVKVVLEKRPADAKKIIPPTHCPSCNTKLVKDEGEVALRCPNYDCPEQKILRITYFASKEGMNIEGMGESYVRTFVKEGFINDIADIYELYKIRDKLKNLEGFGKKSIDNLMNSIDKSKQNTLDVLIKSLGIRYIGEKGSKVLAKRYKTIDDLMKAPSEELSSIYDVGKTMANSIVEFFQKKENALLIEKLKQSNVNTQASDEETIKVNTNINGKKFVITGTLPNLKRNDAKDLITKYGGEVTSAVTKKTNFVVAGDEPGSKLDKAKELGIPIITEEELIKMIEEN